MDVKSYCNSVRIELTQWKAKLYDVIRETEPLSADDKKKVVPTVDEFNRIITELNERIELLDREVPAEWRGHKNEIEDKIAQMKDRWKNVWGAMGERGP